jgi:hypothetical protein
MDTDCVHAEVLRMRSGANVRATGRVWLGVHAGFIVW